jgi:Flp pilus assembly protein TadD
MRIAPARRITCTVLALLAGAGGCTRDVAAPRAGSATLALVPAYRERANRDVQIRVWHQALDADSTSAIALGQLAALHLQRAREGGSWDDYLTAESYARRSLGKRTFRNAATASTLVSILLAQHRFTEARDVAVELVRREPDVPQYRATLAEVAMELGDDAMADTLFRSVWSDRGSLTIAARLARWLELTGHVRQARAVLTTAATAAFAQRELATETKAWFALRQGDLELRAERFAAAEAAYRQGLVFEPNDPRVFAALARLAAAQHRPREVIRWGEQAIGLQLDPGTLGLIGNAYQERGDTAKANEYLRTMQVAVSLQPGAYHRAWSLYLLDHDLQVAEVLQRAEGELRERKDVYGYDIVAWALHKSGRSDDARAMMRRALRLGTPDPLLRRHAAAIGVTVANPVWRSFRLASGTSWRGTRRITSCFCWRLPRSTAVATGARRWW